MNKKSMCRFILKYIEAFINGMSAYVGCVSVLLGISILSFIQGASMTTSQLSEWQQSLFINIVVLACVFCILFYMFDIVFFKRDSVVVLMQMIAVVVCTVVCWCYGNLCAEPLCAVPVESIIYFIAGITVVKSVISRVYYAVIRSCAFNTDVIISTMQDN